jgi:hypothetical protein
MRDARHIVSCATSPLDCLDGVDDRRMRYRRKTATTAASIRASFGRIVSPLGMVSYRDINRTGIGLHAADSRITNP